MVDTPPAPPSIPSEPTPGGAKTMLGETPGGPPAAPPAPPAPPAAPAAPPPPPAPTGVVAPWKEGEVWKVGEADKATEWWNAITEEPVRELMKTKEYKNPAVVAVAYSNLLKLQNGNDAMLAFPPANATPEQQAAFDKTLRSKLGVPETADKYDLKLGDKPDPKFVEFGKKALFDMGVPPGKAQAFVDSWNTFVTAQGAERLAAETAKNDTDVTALETRWGADLNANLAAGKLAVSKLGLSGDLVDAIEAKIGTAAVVELMATLGKKVGEAGWVGGTGGQTNPNDPASMTPAQAMARANALRADPAFEAKYTDAKNPEHAAALATMEALHKRAAQTA